MKHIKLSEFKINARHIAELEWGTGGTNACRTNRPGAYYYSCSGHGGYVVDSRALTAEERAKIDPYVTPRDLQLCIQHVYFSDADVVIGVNYTDFDCDCRIKSRAIMFNRAVGAVRWQSLPVYVFEEDCDWSVLEKFTDIRDKGYTGTEEQRQVAIEECFQRWHGKKEQKAVVA